MVAPVRKSDRACPAQAQQTASAFKHFRPINRNWQPSTAALMQHPRAKLRRKKRAEAKFFKMRAQCSTTNNR
jgi:hypothetical protein